MWSINGPSAPWQEFQAQTLDEVLYEFEGPRIFTTRHGALMQLWYRCAEDDSGSARYLVVPTDLRTVERLKEGTRTVYEALNQAWIWAVDKAPDGSIQGAWVIGSLHDVPHDAKPAKRTPLWPQLVPLLSYRLIGDGLAEGKVPASVIARAVSAPASALKRVLECTLKIGVQGGRPEEDFRKAYDLPATRMAFNSFEVSFGLPSEWAGLFDSQGENFYAPGAQQLKVALDWLAFGDARPEPSVELMEALKELAPPGQGQIVQAEVSGKLLLGRPPFTLTRQHRRVLSQRIATLKGSENRLLPETGRIGALDKDFLTLVLRDRGPGRDDLKCSFSEEKFDDLWDAFESNRRLALFGRFSASQKRFEIEAIDSAEGVLASPLKSLPPGERTPLSGDEPEDGRG